MNELLSGSAVWGCALTLLCYVLFSALARRTKLAFLNPLLLSAAAIIAFLSLGGLPYESYRETSSPLSFLLLPATVCLAVPLYQQRRKLKENALPILCGIAAGSIASLLSVALIAAAFGLERRYAVSLLPKSVTTAIGADISAELGGIPPLTIGVIVLTGIAGNMTAPLFCRLFRVQSPTARGVAIGTCSHAIVTSRALEMGETEGAMSGLSIAVAGILTAVLAPLVTGLL